MATWLNRVAIAVPRNGGTTHIVDPSTDTVVDGSNFTPTAGNFLICIMSGAVTSGSTTGVPATAPTGWTKLWESVGDSGLYCWYKTAAGGDTVTANHNGSNYPVLADFWEFSAGSAFNGSGATAINVFPGAAGAGLSGLTGTNTLISISGNTNSGTSGTVVNSWSLGTEMTDTQVLRGGTPTTDGYAYSTTYVEASVLTSWAPVSTMSGGSPAIGRGERGAFAVTVAAGAPPVPAPAPVINSKATRFRSTYW